MRTYVSVAVLVSAIIQLPTAFALTKTASINVTADVVGTCDVTATSMDFGSVDGTTVGQALGQIQVTCSQGTTYSIALDAGLHYDPNLQVRNIQNANGDNIAYDLLDQSSGLPWGDGNVTNTWPAVENQVGSGSARTYDVGGYLSINGDRGSVYTPNTTYTDTVNVSVNY